MLPVEGCFFIERLLGKGNKAAKRRLKKEKSGNAVFLAKNDRVGGGGVSVYNTKNYV
jgi:hypothetical protein